MHVLDMEGDEIPERAGPFTRSRSECDATIDAAFSIERPFLRVLAAAKGLRRIAALAADLGAPVTGAKPCKGRHCVHSFDSCALRVHREIKTGTNVCNLG